MNPNPLRPPLALLAALATVLACASCGKRADDPRASDDPATGTTLRFWHIMNYSGPEEVLAEAVERFEAAHPGVTVDMQTYDNDAYKTKLAVEMAGGEPPDVFFTWGGGGLASFAEGGKVLDLSAHLAERGWGERFLPAAMRICTVEGTPYAVPLDLSCVPLWYNEPMFEQHDLEPPATFDDLLALCKTLRAKGITPLALGNMKQWPGAFYFVYLAARHGGVDLFLDAAAGNEDARFDDETFVEAGKDLQALVDAKAFSTGFNGIETAQARTQFLHGRAAMLLMGTWLVARAEGENPEFVPDMACCAFPAVEGGAGDPGTVVGGVNCGFAVSAHSEHPELAVDLLRELTSARVAEQWCRIGRIPAVKVSENAPAGLPAPTKAAWELLHAAPALQPYYDQYLPPRLAEVHKSTTQALFAKTTTPEEAARKMAEAAAESR